MAFEAFSDQAEETVAVAGAEERPHRLMATCLQGRWLSHSEDLCSCCGSVLQGLEFLCLRGNVVFLLQGLFEAFNRSFSGSRVDHSNCS